ncbi:serine hydrolase [Microbacter sp. GSS18]|nr:serine hydrolase [Microbacter sp. GSS18]
MDARVRMSLGDSDHVLRFLTILAIGLAATVPASAPDAAIEEFVDDAMPASLAPGIAYAVVADEEEATVGARGVLRSGDDAEITPDTPFLTGSISKSFTALAVMQLVEAGEVALDEGISRYLDGFSGAPAGDITIRQLLSHTSGFSTLQGNASHTDEDGGPDELARTVEALEDVTPDHDPGERWEYSNTNYQILGRLIEVVGGQPFDAYIESRILEPVGMENSFVADGEVHESMATGHVPWFWTKRPVTDTATHRGTAPQGGVIASAADLALYMQMMLNGEDDVLSAEGKALMMRPASDASPFYGFGWFIDSAQGTVRHAGSSPGFETLATMRPADGTGAVVLVNGGSGIGFGETTELRNGITAIALGLDYGGEGSRWSQQALFIGLALLPVFYVISMVWAWHHRAAIRAKSGVAGQFSLWFPLLTTLVAAWVMLSLVPTMMGAPLGTVTLFQPDMGLVLIAGAVTGVVWAVLRLVIAFTGRSRRPDTAQADADDKRYASGVAPK